MIEFFSFMIKVSTIMALVTSAIVILGLLLKSQTFTEPTVLDNCNEQIKICRISSIVFLVLSWFIVSGQTTVECLAGYSQLSDRCLELGFIWIIFAFVNVCISILLGIMKRPKSNLDIIAKMRRSAFLMGGIYLIISVLLQVY